VSGTGSVKGPGQGHAAQGKYHKYPHGPQTLEDRKSLADRGKLAWLLAGGIRTDGVGGRRWLRIAKRGPGWGWGWGCRISFWRHLHG
jgi:hypothetical protein